MLCHLEYHDMQRCWLRCKLTLENHGSGVEMDMLLELCIHREQEHPTGQLLHQETPFDQLYSTPHEPVCATNMFRLQFEEGITNKSIIIKESKQKLH